MLQKILALPVLTCECVRASVCVCVSSLSAREHQQSLTQITVNWQSSQMISLPRIATTQLTPGFHVLAREEDHQHCSH